MKAKKKSDQTINVSIQGDVSGQVAAGNRITQRQTKGVSKPAVSEAELNELRAALKALQELVEKESPAELKSAAVDKVGELQEAVTAQKPDLTTMEYVRNWFVKHLPKLAGYVGSVIVHPIVGRLVEAAGTAVTAEFQHRFGK